MHLKISDTARKWAQEVTQQCYDEPKFEWFSLVGRYREAVEKVNEARTQIARITASSQTLLAPSGIFKHIKLLRIFAEYAWRSNMAYLIDLSERDIAKYEPMTDDILAKFASHTFELGQALERWLKLYNHLAEGQRLGQLGEEQVKSVQGARPILEHALGYFEQCVSLHRWHTAHAQMKDVQPASPTVGLQLEELQEVVTRLTACVSDDILDHTNTMVEREVALIELQRQLGAIPGFSVSTA